MNLKSYVLAGAKLLAVGIVSAVIVLVFVPKPAPGPVPPPIPVPAVPNIDHPIIAPEIIKVKTGTLEIIQVKSLGPVTWVIDPCCKDRFQIVPINDYTAHIVAQKDGEYHLALVTVVSRKISQPIYITIQAGLGPNPPPPPPVPPVPDSPMAKAIQAAWAQETDGKKADHVKFLAAVYRQMSGNFPPNIRTANDLFNVLRQAVAVELKADDLSKVRTAIANILDSSLPTDPATQVNPEACRQLFSQIAVILEGLK